MIWLASVESRVVGVHQTLARTVSPIANRQSLQRAVFQFYDWQSQLACDRCQDNYATSECGTPTTWCSSTPTTSSQIFKKLPFFEKCFFSIEKFPISSFEKKNNSNNCSGFGRQVKSCQNFSKKKPKICFFFEFFDIFQNQIIMYAARTNGHKHRLNVIS